VPCCSGRILVAPTKGEQPDPNTPRCSYCWLKGSMMRFECTEISQLVLLLPLWYLKLKVLFIKFVITWALKCINPYSVRRRKYAITQDKNYLVLVLYYYDINNQSFLLRWLTFNIYLLLKKDGQLRWFLLLPAAILLTTESPSLRKATNCWIVGAKERVFLQLEGFQFTIIFVKFC